MISQAEDIEFGKKSELSLHEKIEKLVGGELKWNGGMALFDYSNNAKTIYAELKTRRIRHDEYDTALIGLNKIEFCKPGTDYYFVYSYLDGIYYIKYDKALFDTFRVQYQYKRGNRLGCNNYASDVMFIPRNHLRKFEM